MISTARFISNYPDHIFYDKLGLDYGSIICYSRKDRSPNKDFQMKK